MFIKKKRTMANQNVRCVLLQLCRPVLRKQNPVHSCQREEKVDTRIDVKLYLPTSKKNLPGSQQ